MKRVPTKCVSSLIGLLLFGLSAVTVTSPANAAPIQDPSRLSTTPDRIWDVDVRSGLARHTGTYLTLVWDLQEINGVMYVGGDFTKVVAPDGTQHDRSFLAAFDLESGEWIPSFASTISGPIYSLDVTSQGNLVVGGEFAGGVALVNPTTGARVAGFDADLDHSWGHAAVFTVTASGGDIYAGGRFVRGQGLALDNLAKLDAGTGQVDPAWLPTVEPVLYQGVMQERIRDIEVDSVNGRVYVGGLFGSMNGDLETDSLAVLSPVDGSTLMAHPNVAYDDRPIVFLYDITLSNGLVRYGGKENFTITVNNDGFARQGDVIYTNNGDHQVIHEGSTTLWIGCHCWKQAFTTTPPHNPFEPTANAIDVNAVFGLDKATGELIPITFDLKGAAGAWAIEEDQNGRLWVAGQFTQGGGRKLTGIARFSQTAGADAEVTACTVTRNGVDADVEWVNQAAPDAFVIRRSVNGGTTYWRGRADGNRSAFTDSDRQAPLVYTVESRVGANRLGEAVICTEVVGEVDPPTGLRATRVTRERVVLNWVGNGEIEIERDGVVIGTDSDRWYTDRTVGAGTAYEYRVRYVGQQTWSDPISVTTL